jgi:hypothetical protein
MRPPKKRKAVPITRPHKPCIFLERAIQGTIRVLQVVEVPATVPAADQAVAGVPVVAAPAVAVEVRAAVDHLVAAVPAVAAAVLAVEDHLVAVVAAAVHLVVVAVEMAAAAAVEAGAETGQTALVIRMYADAMDS